MAAAALHGADVSATARVRSANNNSGSRSSSSTRRSPSARDAVVTVVYHGLGANSRDASRASTRPSKTRMVSGDVLVDWRLLARLAMLGVLGVYFDARALLVVPVRASGSPRTSARE